MDSETFISTCYLLHSMEVKLRCKRCGHRWTYRGNNEYWASCPHCYTKVKVVAADDRSNDLIDVVVESVVLGDD
jgi:Zn finger protein HypA/HybF involved in hydrogenase expression